jgi:DNA processing protein
MTDAPLACLQLIHSTARSGKIREALMHYRNPAMAWEALCQIDRSLKSGLKPKQALLDRGRTWLETPGNHVIAWHEPDYPPPLRQTASPPPFLFVGGRRDLLWHPPTERRRHRVRPLFRPQSHHRGTQPGHLGD